MWPESFFIKAINLVKKSITITGIMNFSQGIVFIGAPCTSSQQNSHKGEVNKKKKIKQRERESKLNKVKEASDMENKCTNNLYSVKMSYRTLSHCIRTRHPHMVC